MCFQVDETILKNKFIQKYRSKYNLKGVGVKVQEKILTENTENSKKICKIINSLSKNRLHNEVQHELLTLLSTLLTNR